MGRRPAEFERNDLKKVAAGRFAVLRCTVFSHREINMLFAVGRRLAEFERNAVQKVAAGQFAALRCIVSSHREINMLFSIAREPLKE